MSHGWVLFWPNALMCFMVSNRFLGRQDANIDFTSSVLPKQYGDVVDTVRARSGKTDGLVLILLLHHCLSKLVWLGANTYTRFDNSDGKLTAFATTIMAISTSIAVSKFGSIGTLSLSPAIFCRI